jgi:hypothetical protein
VTRPRTQLAVLRALLLARRMLDLWRGRSEAAGPESILGKPLLTIRLTEARSNGFDWALQSGNRAPAEPAFRLTGSVALTLCPAWG